MTGLTPGFYVTRDARYEVDRDGRVWLVGKGERREVQELPGDAAMTTAAMRAGSGGATFEQTHEGNESAD